MIAWAIGLAHAVSFGPAVLADGTRVVQDHRTSLDLPLDVTLLGTRSERHLERTHVQTCSLVVDGDATLLRWSENRHRATEPGHAHDRVLPVVGPTYRVMPSGPSREDGLPMSDEEASIVGAMRLPEQLARVRAMLGDGVDVGHTVPAGPLFAGILDDAPGEPSLVSGSLRLERVIHEGSAEVGVFAVDLALRSDDLDAKGTRITTEARATGWLHVEVASGLARLLDLEGTVTVEAVRTGLHTTGSGTFHTRTALSYP